jgi:hypothetical protein
MKGKTGFHSLMVWKSWIICGALSVLSLLFFVVSLFEGDNPDLPWYERAPFTLWLYGASPLLCFLGPPPVQSSSVFSARVLPKSGASQAPRRT